MKIGPFYLLFETAWKNLYSHSQIYYAVDTDKTIDSFNTLKPAGHYFSVSGALPHPLKDSTVIFYGSARADSGRTFGYAILEFDLANKTSQLHTDSCWSNNITNLLYDSSNNRYVALSNLPLCNGNAVASSTAYGYFDNNFNLITPVSDGVSLTYTPYYTTFKAIINTAMEWTSDGTIMVAGNIPNPYSGTKPASSKSGHWINDMAVSMRNSSNFSEVDSTMSYGEKDIAEIVYPEKLAKFDSNLFVLASTYELELFSVKPWDTELTLLGLDENGQKHWIRNFSFQDYCSTKDIHPDDNGGLWVVAQCETVPFARPYEKFVKVMYIDSVAYWPRNGLTTDLKENASLDNKINIYPNPASHEVSIQQFGDLQNLEIIIYDVSGREMKKEKLSRAEKTIDVSWLRSGMYVVKIIDNSANAVSRKLMIR